MSGRGGFVRISPYPVRGLNGMNDSNGKSIEKRAAAEVGHVHSVESAGMIDGPGVRFVVFLAGCPLRCIYCHNPDTACSSHGELRTAESVLDEVRRQRPFLRRGGVTFSGGEPMMQPGFLRALLRGCREMGLHTAVDTSGFLGVNADSEILDLTDLWLLDIKSSDPDTYRRVTGVELQPTLDFARRLAAAGKRMWVRFVLVPGLTDEPGNIDGVAAITAELGDAVEKAEVLPFHQLGRAKWESLGKTYPLADTPPAGDEETEAARERFRQVGVRCD